MIHNRRNLVGAGPIMRDSDVRAALRARLNQQHASDGDTRIVEEMGIWSNSVRVDLAVINGELSGFEIKSDSDTLDRLPHQAEIYNKVFDRVTLVVGERLAPKALAAIPPWWGCSIAKMKGDGVTLTVRRKGRRNPSPDPELIAQMLWKDEAIAALAKHGLDRGWRSKRSGEICNRLVNSLSFETLTHHVRSALKARSKLGQIVSGDLNVPIHVVADPTARISGAGATICNLVNSRIAPAVRERAAPGVSDYCSGVLPKLAIHGDSAWALNLDAMEDKELVGESILGVDRDRRGNADCGRIRKQTSVVAKIQPIGKPRRRKRTPKR